MAAISFEGIEELNSFLSQFSEIPEDVQEDMLNSMAEVAAQGQRETGKSFNVYDPEWTGKHVLDSISVRKAKKNKNGVMQSFVTFRGTRTRGNTKTRNAAIAFMNEYGVNRKNIAAKPFVSTSNSKNIKKICQAGEKVYNRWIDTISKEK